MEEEKKDPEYALSMANIAMNEAVRGHDRITRVENDLNKVSQSAQIARALCNDLESAHNGAMSGQAVLRGMIDSHEFKIRQLEESNHDLNMSLSETNERLETLELLMSGVQTTAPIAVATDAEAELVGQLMIAEEQLTQALQLIYDIRKKARETGDMNTNEWMELGQRSVAILELHKII